VPWNYTATTWFVPKNDHTNSQVLLKLSTTDDVKRIVFIHARVMYVASYRFEIWKDGVKVDEKINSINASDYNNGAGYGTNTDIKYAYNAGAFASVVFDSIPKADTPIIWHNYDYRINDILLSLKPTYEDAFTKLKTIRAFYSKLAYGPSFDILDHKFNLITHTARVDNYDEPSYYKMVASDALVIYNVLESDSVSGTTLKDFSGNNRHGTITGGLNIVDNGFVFTGSNFVYLDGIGNPSGDWPHTISIWLSIDEFPTPVTTTQQRQDPFYIGTNANGKSSSLDLTKNSDVDWYFYGVDVGRFSNNGITANTWFHLCLVYDSSNTKYFYINGELKFQLISSANNLDSDTPLWLGLDGPRNTSKWKGKLRQFGVYDRVFTAEEVIQNYKAGTLSEATIDSMITNNQFIAGTTDFDTSITMNNIQKEVKTLSSDDSSEITLSTNENKIRHTTFDTNGNKTFEIFYDANGKIESSIQYNVSDGGTQTILYKKTDVNTIKTTINKDASGNEIYRLIHYSDLNGKTIKYEEITPPLDFSIQLSVEPAELRIYILEQLPDEFSQTLAWELLLYNSETSIDIGESSVNTNLRVPYEVTYTTPNISNNFSGNFTWDVPWSSTTVSWFKPTWTHSSTEPILILSTTDNVKRVIIVHARVMYTASYRCELWRNNVKIAEGINTLNPSDASNPAGRDVDGISIQTTFERGAYTSTTLTTVSNLVPTLENVFFQTTISKIQLSVIQVSYNAYYSSGSTLCYGEHTIVSNGIQLVSKSTSNNWTGNSAAYGVVLDLELDHSLTYRFKIEFNDETYARTWQNVFGIMIGSSQNAIYLSGGYHYTAVYHAYAENDIILNRSGDSVSTDTIYHYYELKIINNIPIINVYPDESYSALAHSFTYPQSTDPLTENPLKSVIIYTGFTKSWGEEQTRKYRTLTVSDLVAVDINKYSTKHELLSLENYEKSSFANDSQAIDLNNVIVNLTNTNFTLSLRGPSNSWSFIKLNDTIIDMYIGNIYTFDMYMTQNTLSTRYGGMVFGHDFPMNSKVQDNPSPAAINWNFEIDANDASWKHYHNNFNDIIWKNSDKEGLGTETNDSGISTINEDFVRYWKLTVIKHKNGKKDLLIEGFSDIERTILKYWTYVSYLGNYPNNDIQYLQHDTIHFGIVHGSGVGTNEYTILENVIHHGNKPKSIAPSKGLYTIAYDNNEFIYDLYGNLIQSANIEYIYDEYGNLIQNITTYSDNSKVITDINLDESKTITSYSPDNHITDVRTITPKTTVDTITTFTTSIEKYSFTLIDTTKSIDSKIITQGSITFSGSYPASFLDLTSLDGTTNNSIYPNKGTTEFILMENDRTANFNKSLNESVLDILTGLIQLPTWNQSLVGAFDITLSENSTILLGSENGRSTNYGRPFLKHVFGVSDDDFTVINGHGWIGQNGTPWAETSPMVWQSIPVSAGTYNITNTAMDLLESNKYNWMIMGIGYIDNNSYQLIRKNVITTELDSNNESLTKETITLYDNNDTILENTIVETTKNNDNSLTIVKQPVQTLFKLEYNVDGPISNFDYINLIGTDVKYVLENDKYVAEYGTTKGSDNASINATVHELRFVAPDRDFLIDIIFKTPSNALAERHSLFAITSASNTHGFQVYTPNGETGYQATTWPWDSSPSHVFFIKQGGWAPALNQYGRYTFIFRKSTNKLEVLLNGAKDIPIANNTNYHWSSVSDNIIDIIDEVNFFGKEVSIKLGHGRNQAYTNSTTYLRFESCYVKTFDIPETPISTIDQIPNLPYEYTITTSTINQDGSSVQIVKDDLDNIISTTTTSVVDSDGNINISTTNSDNTSSEITKNKEGTTTVNKDSYGNIVNTITSTTPDEFGYITQTTVNSDNSSSVIITDKFESTSQTIQTTTVSAPDGDGNITETTSKLDGSESIVIKDSSNNITQTTTISVPDEDGNTTEIITSADGLETTVIKDSSDNIIQSTSVSTPDQDGNITETSIIDGITTTIIKDNSGSIIQTSSTDVDNNIIDTIYNDDLTKSVEVKNSSGSIIQTSTISAPDQNDYKIKSTYDVLSETQVVQSTFPPKYTNTFWTTKTMSADGSDKLFWVNTYDNITYEIYGSSYRENEEPYRVFSRNIDHSLSQFSLSLSIIEKQSYNNDGTTSGDSNLIDIVNTLTSIKLRGPSPTWSYIKLAQTIQMKVGNIYFFDFFMDQVGLSKRYGGLIFGHDFATTQGHQWNPSMEAVNFSFKLYANNASWDHWHVNRNQSVWKNSSNTPLSTTNDPSTGSSSMNHVFVQYWKLTVVERGSQKDLRLEGFSDSTRQTLQYWAYVSEIGNYQNNDIQYLQYDQVHIGIVHGSSVGTNEYVHFSNWVAIIDRIANYEINYTDTNQIHAWHSDNETWDNITAIIKISEPINIQSYYFRARHYTSYTQRPSKWNIYVSNDSTTWIQIDSRDNEANNYTLNTVKKFDAPAYEGYYQWVKIVVHDQDNGWWSQSDWRFDGTYVDKQQTITFLDYNDTLISYQPFPSKYTNAGWQSKTMYADGGNKLFWFNTYDNITYEIYGNSYRSGEEPYRVFSRNINTHEDYETNNGSIQIHAWHSNTDAWTTIEAIIKVSVSINIQSYYFRARHYTSPTQRPSKWSIYVSNDSDTWIEIDSRDNEAANYTLDAIRKFNTPHYQGYYKWIKIVVYNQDNTWWSQSDWRFDGSTEILDLNEYKLLHIDFSQDTIFDASKHSRSFVENTMGTTTINGIKAGQTNSGSQHILIDGVGDSQLVSWDFTAVLVLELGAKLGSWDNFFLWQWRVGWSIKDNMFILGSVMKRDGDATTSPDWRFEGNKVILIAKHNQSNMTFNIYRLSDGYMYSTNTRTVTPSMISYIQNYTLGEHSTNTSGREVIIGAGFYYEPESSWREGANAKYGEVVFLNTHLDDTQESNMVSQFVAKWN